MKHQKAFTVTAFLFTLAALFAMYLVYDHYQIINAETDYQSLCSINKYLNCNLVNSSRFSVFLGIPVAAFGLSYYLFALVLSLAAARSIYAVREASLLLIPMSVFSVAVSIILSILSLVSIKALCLFCTTLHVLNLITAVLLFWATKDTLFHLVEEIKKIKFKRLAGFFAAGIAILAVVIGASGQLAHPIPFDIKAFIQEYENAPTVTLELGTSPRLGNQSPQSPIQLVEFSDFECPFCAKQSRQLTRILRNYPQVQMIFKHFPLDMSCNALMKMPLHMNACLAARAAWCSQEQNGFADFSEKLFSHQHEFNTENMKRWARDIGLDVSKFEECLSNDRSRAGVDADLKQGAHLGIHSTPTFFINGRKVEGIVTDEVIRYLLEQQRKNP